ncbi:MAG: ribosomal RNA small subunit methyltransferase A [Acidobacteria bacterium]|nr:MAG: ribosomal RNA small subunit methyltransferase A [Acidobacteriota bacterium]
MPSAKKSLGQNFLVNPGYIDRIITALDPGETDRIIEIGPGKGAITKRLVQSGALVFAIEIDPRLSDFLRQQIGNNDRFKLIVDDALKIDFKDLLDETQERAKLVANLPYYISTAILQRLILQRNCFDFMVLMFQKEVADRLVAEAGSSGRGYLTVLAETFLQIERLFDVPPSAFRPVPKVWSSVLKIKPLLEVSIDIETYSKILEISFAHKRKMLFNNLRRSDFMGLSEDDWLEVLRRSGILPSCRAEDLTRQQWMKLYEVLKSRRF